ncbi:MAG: hypothetical protein LBE74_10095 [Treponema sp.]|jgi:hypothetical protein|nr:hypothetical protein [Treponema sp.]
MYTIFVALGGTGTQIGYAIGNIYPLLQTAGISQSKVDMYILDKDTKSGIYIACSDTNKNYGYYKPLLPFKSLPVWNLKLDVYQEMQEKNALRNSSYTVMDLIGDDKIMRDLASMCWVKDKRDESIKDGNNRDPSRGSLDAHVCLEYLEESSLFEGIEKVKSELGEAGVRVVILGGATGGMGASLIVPLAKQIREKWQNIRIDMALLGTYFAIPQRKVQPGVSDVDNIGTSFDSFYRVADQMQELAAIADNWRVYYTAIPEFDDTCGKFEKNGADKRKAHLLELSAALAAFALESLPPGFYHTVLSYDENAADSGVEWAEIPFGAEIKKTAEDFMRLFSISADILLPLFSKDKQALKNDPYLKFYLKKPADSIEIIEKMREKLKKWLDAVKPFFDFWNEIQIYTRLGRKDGKTIVKFFPEEEMRAFAGVINSTQAPWENKIPLYPETWNNFANDLEPNKKELMTAKDDPDKLLTLMIKDVYEKLSRRAA